jgi:elongation factor G
MGDLNRRRGQITSIDTKGKLAVVRCAVPLKEMFGYATAVRTLSSGRASYSMTPSHFEQVPNNIVEQIVSERGGTSRF